MALMSSEQFLWKLHNGRHAVELLSLQAIRLYTCNMIQRSTGLSQRWHAHLPLSALLHQVVSSGHAAESVG